MWPFGKAQPEKQFLDAVNRHLSKFPEDKQMELLTKARESSAATSSSSPSTPPKPGRILPNQVKARVR
jgi:hypothetical protein